MDQNTRHNLSSTSDEGIIVVDLSSNDIPFSCETKELKQKKRTSNPTFLKLKKHLRRNYHFLIIFLLLTAIFIVIYKNELIKNKLQDYKKIYSNNEGYENKKQDDTLNLKKTWINPLKNLNFQGLKDISQFIRNQKSKYVSKVETLINKSCCKKRKEYLEKYTYLVKIFNNDDKNSHNNEFLHRTPTVVLYRTIGNDLPPRHEVGQSFRNVKFIIENEKKLKDTAVRWIVNRIVNSTEEERILQFLEETNQTYIHLPFHLTKYGEIPLSVDLSEEDEYHKIFSSDRNKISKKDKMEIVARMFHYKNLYAMNNNGARNLIIEQGIKENATWILPFDGNCFFTEEAWEELLQRLPSLDPNIHYFVVPMARIVDNNQLLGGNDKHIVANEEPQIAFHRESIERFNENMRYGRRSKIELLWRLKVKGPWDSWPKKAGIWDNNKFDYTNEYIPPEGYPVLSWVARLYSGKSHLESVGTISDRGMMRILGIERLLVQQDESVMRNIFNFNPKTRLIYYKEDVLKKEKESYLSTDGNKKLKKVVENLIKCADLALTISPFSVINKTKNAPSGDKKDYYTPSPYYWPNPDTPDHTPYIRKDGVRVPGTILYDEFSEQYDRSRLASLHGNVTCLALAWFYTDRFVYAAKAAVFLRTWFLNPATRMNPSLRYAQIRWGYNLNVGSQAGCIETKDFYFFLDAVRLVERAGTLTPNEIQELRTWFTEFGNYLSTSSQGLNENSAKNNHGLYYDVQLAAIAAFIDNIPMFLNHTDRAKSRLQEQFTEIGVMPHEITRKSQLHYIMFTLQGWLTLVRLTEGTGIKLKEHVPLKNLKANPQSHPILEIALMFNNPYFNSTWTNPQENLENLNRLLPLYFQSILMYPQLEFLESAQHYLKPVSLYDAPCIFYPHYGIPYFWNLGLTDKYL